MKFIASHFQKRSLRSAPNFPGRVLEGFTLVEVLVSIAIFVLAVSLGVLAVTTMDQASKRVRLKDQTIQSAYFMMDSISRSIRTGYEYKCLNASGGVVDPCPSTSATGTPGLQYLDQDGRMRKILFVAAPANKVQSCKELDPIGSGNCTLTDYHSPDALKVNFMEFTGGGMVVGDSTQPYITIRAQVSYTFKGIDYPISFQTSLTQRKLDPDN